MKDFGRLLKLTLKEPKNIKDVLDAGVPKMIEVANKTIKDAVYQYAKMAVVEAISFYDDSIDPRKNLTGNTRTSFCAGIYHDKNFVDSFVGYREAGIEAPTYFQAKPGDKHFPDYGSGEFIGNKSDPYVRQYNDGSFVGTNSADYGTTYSYIQTLQFLQNPSNVNLRSNGWICVLASVSPYVEFLYQVRGFDILETTMENRIGDLRAAIRFAFVKNKV